MALLSNDRLNVIVPPIACFCLGFMAAMLWVYFRVLAHHPGL